jgi:glycosyltransferase involved in cell wall biosynthesis
LHGGDRIRTWHLARQLATLGPVDVIATRRADESPAAIRAGLPFVDRLELPLLGGTRAALRSLLAGVSGRSLQQAVYDCPVARVAVQALLVESPPDVVVAHLVRTAPWLPDPPHPPLVVDIQDALSAQYSDSRGYRRGWRGLAMALESRPIGAAEQAAVARASALSFISASDRDAVPHAGVVSVLGRAAIDLDRFSPQGSSEVPGRVGFLGNLRTASNRDMIVHFARALFPAIRSAVPWAELHIMGHEAGADVRRLGRLPGIVFVGPVDDQVPELEACCLTVCPLRFGSGVQNKILESLAVGTPVIASPGATAALVSEDAPCPVISAELGAPFTAAVIALLGEHDRRVALGTAGQDWVRTVHRPERALAPLLDLVKQLGAASGEPARGMRDAAGPAARGA